MNRRTLLSGALFGAVPGRAISQNEQSMTFTSRDGVETRTNKTIRGPLRIATEGGNVSVSSGSDPIDKNLAVLSVSNFDTNTCGLRICSYWEGESGSEYHNNDGTLIEVFNTTLASSHNRSWAVSACNAMHNIPAGVTDTGTRVGVLGWATSINYMGYVHEGTLTQQVGVYGRAGFQGTGSGPSARITEAVGVRGEIVFDSAGSTVDRAIAGQFVSRDDDYPGNVGENTAVYASARGGTVDNYSFYGADGNFFNAAKSFFGSLFSQVKAAISARRNGNSIEFGPSNPSGYASTIGATNTYGFPFVAFSAEADDSGDTFTTRGKPGSVIYGDLAGGVVFARVPGANSAGQSMLESGRFNQRGNLCLSRNPPASSDAAGTPGEVAWDENFVYICIAPNFWRRCAHSGW